MDPVIQKSAPESNPISWKVRFLPIIFFLVYLNFTVFLFAFGPWNWPVADGTKLYVFLGLAHLLLFLGYFSAAFQTPRGYSGKWKIEHVVLIGLIVNLVLLVPTSAFRTGSSMPDILGGIDDPGQVYKTSNEFRAEGGGLAEYLRILAGPLLFLLLPLTVFYWRRLKWLTRGLSAVAILGFLAMYVAIGTNKALADFVLLTPSLIVANYFARSLSGDRRLAARNRTSVFRSLLKVLSVIGSIVIFLLFFSFFTTAMISRARSMEGVTQFPALGISADTDNFLVRDLPEEAKVGAIALSSYLTQGYYGLYLSLDEPFIPMFGVGNSFFLSHNAARIIGNRDIELMPYPMRLSRWDGYGNWSSIYPWIASDVSFPGTLLVVFLIGRLFALSWLDTLRGSNPFAIAAFAQFLIMLFYFSGNNQALQTGEALTSFFGVLAFWLFTRKRDNSGTT
jgi:hypothetical protein